MTHPVTPDDLRAQFKLFPHINNAKFLGGGGGGMKLAFEYCLPIQESTCFGLIPRAYETENRYDLPIRIR